MHMLGGYEEGTLDENEELRYGSVLHENASDC
jgi:hypothetical protein